MDSTRQFESCGWRTAVPERPCPEGTDTQGTAMAELTPLQKKSSDATAFAHAVNVIVLSIEYIPNDQTSIERAITTMKNAVMKAASGYPDNEFVRSTRDQLLAAYEANFRKTR